MIHAVKVEPLFCTWIKRNVPDWSSCIVVAPDEGGAKRSAMIANYLGNKKILGEANIYRLIKESRGYIHICSMPGSMSVRYSGYAGKVLPKSPL